MKTAEIYRSIQGEGLLTGTPSVFVRASGCNLRCWFCDTPFASWKPEGRDLSVDEIVAEVEEWDCRHVVITGGEPMLFSELIPLCEKLRSRRRHITIETAGTLFLPVACNLMSISPKLAGSAPNTEEHPRWSRRHERTRHRPEVIRQLMENYTYQLKFVVDQPGDLEEIDQYLSELPAFDPERVLLMPQGTELAELEERAGWIKQHCSENGYTYCPRKQIEWWRGVRGT